MTWPFENDTSGIVKRISNRSISANRKRNIFIVLTIVLASALLSAIVLADEPTGNLDSKTSAEVLGLIKRTSAEFRQTVVMITHNDDIARLADRIVRIEDGKIVE